MSVTLNFKPNLPRSLLLIAPRRGEDVLQVLREALAEREVGNAWVVGRGTFDEVELRDGDATRTFATTSRIVALDGRVFAGDGGGQLSLAATVSRSGTRGPEFLVGEIVRAVAGTMELMVTPLELASAMHLDPKTTGTEEPGASPDPGLLARDDRGARVARADAPPSPWAALAEASADAHARPAAPAKFTAPRAMPVTPSAPRSPTYDPRKPGSPSPLPPPTAPIPPRRKAVDEEIYPEPGDLLDHFAFGRCVVLQSDGDEMVVQNPTSGRTRTLRVSALHAVEEPTEEEGKRLFRLTQKRPT